RIFVSLRNQKNSNCNVSGVNNCSTPIQTIDDLNNVISTPLYLSYSVKDWQNLDYNFEVGETPVRLRFKALADGWSSSTAINDIWVDNIRVTELDGSPVKGYLMIVSPLTNQSFKQRDSMIVVLKLLDANANQFEGPTQAEYKLKDSDSWQQIQLTKNYQKEYYFFVTAPNEIGDHNLSVRVFMNGGWVEEQTTYKVYAIDLDLKINFIKAIQVIEDVDLVAGKATAVKVGVNNTNDLNEKKWVKLTLSFNGIDKNQTKKFVGDYNFIFYVDNPYEEAGDYTITAEIDPNKIFDESDENNNYENTDVAVKNVKTLVLIFTPVEKDVYGHYTYNKDLFLGNYYINNFDTYYEDIINLKDFLYSTYPLDEVIVIPKFSVYCLEASCPIHDDYNADHLHLYLEGIRKEQELAGGILEFLNFEYRVVGILPENWFSDRVPPFSKSGGVTDRGKSVLGEYPHTVVLAHEVGHTVKYNGLHLCEEYWDNNIHEKNCANPTPIDSNSTYCVDLNYAPGTFLGNVVKNGIWVEKGPEEEEFYSVDEGLCNLNNTFSFMGRAKYLPPRRWATYDEYQHIFSAFETTGQTYSYSSGEDILLLSGLIEVNLNVALDEAYVIKGQEFGYSDGNCAIRTIDVNGQNIGDYNFAVSFIIQTNPPTESNYSSFLLGVPFSEDINSVQVICNGELKAERFVSANAPSVSFVSPSGGEQWTGDNLIEWTASDLDGDDLEYVLQYSDDNGSTWNPLGMHVTDTNFTFDVGMVDGNTSYKIKVIATDGVLTGEAISNTFTILNPNIEIEPSREIDLETINNLQNVVKDFNIVNTGNADLNVFDMNYSDNLNVTGLTLPIILQPGESHSFSVTLNVLGMNLGSFEEDINLASNDPNQIIKRVKIYGEIEQAKPDFRVTAENISFNPVYPDENGNVTVSALIENLGDLNASNVSVSFYALDKNTVALYKADSNSGTILIDETGNHNGSFKALGEPAWTENSRFGVSALRFDGTNDYISVPDNSELDLVNELSVELWFYFDDSTAWQGLIAKRNQETDSTTNFGLNTNGTAMQWYFRETGAGAWDILSFSAPSRYAWHHFMGTFRQVNPTTVEAKVYVDGNLQANTNLTGNLSNTVNSHDLIIGSSAINVEPFDGLIDEIRISNKIGEPFEFTAEKIIPFIDANSSALVSADWNSIPVGTQKVYVSVDQDNLIDERNETNNYDYNSITVYSEPMLSGEFGFNPVNDFEEQFDLNITIENLGAKLLNANAELILPEGLTITDSLTKSIGTLNSHETVTVNWNDINAGEQGLKEIIVNIKGTNADENFSAITLVRRIEVQDLNVVQTLYPDDTNLAEFEVKNFNSDITYDGLYYRISISGPENYSTDQNTGVLYAGQTKSFSFDWNAWKQTGNYTLTVSLYDYFDELVDQKQDVFEVIPYKATMLLYYSTDGLDFNSEFSSYADYFSSAVNESNELMTVYSYDGDLNYAIRNPETMQWTTQYLGIGNYPYLVADGSDFQLVYVDSGVKYRKYSGSWSSAELVSNKTSVDPVLTADGSRLIVLFSSDTNSNKNIFLTGFNGTTWENEMELTHCRTANCVNPVVLDEGLVEGKIAYAYRKFTGEEYESLDSNLMSSLFDVNYFYWSEVQ
ncbi:MAG: LamG-like jellyroll fold domain-containing protein, partial [archaeon]